MEVKADEGGVTYTRGGYQWFILPAGYLGSAFWGMVLVVASTNSITLRIAAALLLSALVVVLIIAKNIRVHRLLGCDLDLTRIHIPESMEPASLHHFIHGCNELYVFCICDAEKFAEICPCPCNSVGWGGVIWGFISFVLLLAAAYLGLVSLS